MKYLGNNIDNILKIRSINYATIQKETGIHSSQLIKFSEGRSKPHPKTLQKLADFFNISPIDLVEKEITSSNYHSFIKKEFIANTSTNSLTPILEVQLQKIRHLPLFEQKVFANTNFLAMDNLRESPIDFVAFSGLEEAEFALVVFGDSMAPRYNSGDIIFCKRASVHEIEWGRMYIIITPEDRYLKYLDKGEEEETITLRSHNEHYAPFEIKKERVLKIFKCLTSVYKPNG